MLRVGYRIRLASGKGPDREGVITALVGSMLRVRWPSQEETIVIPGPGTVTVLASSGDDVPSAVPPGPSAAKRAAAKKAVPKRTAAKKTATKKAVPSKATPKKAAAKKAAPKKPPDEEEGRDWENGVRQEERADQDRAAAVKTVANRRRERGAEVADLVRVSENAHPGTDRR